MSTSKKPKIFAHRGARTQAPENSQKAFELALEQQADGLECDIQLSRDGIPLLWHDDSLERIGLRNKCTSHYKWEDLQLLDISPLQSYGYESYTGLLSLEEFLCRFSHKTTLLLEIKNQSNDFGSRHNSKIDKTLEIIENTTLPERQKSYFISSFDFESLCFAHQRSPQFNYIANIEELESPKQIADFYTEMPFLNGVCIDLKIITPEACTVAREFNLSTAVYTCNNGKDLLKAMKCNVDTVITDYPGRMRFILNSQEKIE